MGASGSCAETRTGLRACGSCSRSLRRCGRRVSVNWMQCSKTTTHRSEDMPITKITSDPATLTITVVGDYPVPVARLWEAYADPRQLEKFWGPETWPATFTRHDMAAGGKSQYYMTGPDGTRAHGWWRILTVEPRRRLEVEDGFADEEGRPNAEMPTMRVNITFAETPTG